MLESKARPQQGRMETADGRRAADLPFLLLTLILLGIGVVMVLSASFASAYYDIQGETGHDPVYFFSRQAVFAAAGVGVMWLFSRIPMETYHKFSGAAMAAALACLAAVPVVGTVVNGARRWINLGFTTFQPSEITKIAIILYFSALICKYRDRMRTFRYGILPFAAVLLVVAVLLILEPHFSATIIIFRSHRGRLADCAVTLRHRLRRPDRTGAGREPSEISLSPGGAQRFYFLCGL